MQPTNQPKMPSAPMQVPPAPAVSQNAGNTDPHDLFNQARAAVSALVNHPQVGRHMQDILNQINKSHSRFIRQQIPSAAMGGIGVLGAAMPSPGIGGELGQKLSQLQPPTMPKKK